MIQDPNIFELVIHVYVLLCVTHLTLQFVMAHLHHRRHRRELREEAAWMERFRDPARCPSISVIYPIYNEHPAVLEKVFATARECLSIPGLELIFVDDGSPNREQLEPIYEKYQDHRILVLYKENGGKRSAQALGFERSKGEFLITVDSDTLIEREGVCRILIPLLKNPRIGAVSGEVRVENHAVNLLTRLIGIRYWIAFNLERAAQSLVGSMLCCSGPFSAYRRSVIEQVQQDYLAQEFLGRRCTYGDDRHLTNLVLMAGPRTVYQEGAIAHTYVPESLGEYIQQQNRWNKSFFREILWTLGQPRRFHPYALYDMLLQPLLFLGFIFILAHNFFALAYTRDWRIAAAYAAMILIVASLRVLYGWARTLNPAFFAFLLYGFLHVTVLIPVRFKSLLTLKDNAWGTRQRFRTHPYVNFSLWTAGFLAVVGGLSFWMGSQLGEPVGQVFSGGADGAATAQIWSWIRSWNYTLIGLPLVTCIVISLLMVFERRDEARRVTETK